MIYILHVQVNLAAQTLSTSVADAIEFLKDINHPKFQGSEPTIMFIKNMDKLFDILNSRSPRMSGFKSPLRTSNEVLWRPFLEEMVSYLIGLTDVVGKPLYKTTKKTPFVGFIVSIISVMGIYDDYVKTEKLNYLLTYKCSQDHLETFFCSIR